MKTGCMLCGAPLQYFNQPRTLACAVCGERFQADAACENGHYVCDACHAASAGEAVVRACLHASERNPAKIALRIMRHPAVHMHGPEHHALTGCVLLAAYHASGGAAELETGLPEIVPCGGPRCCKRDTFLALRAAVAFTAQQTGVQMEWDDSLACEFSAENRECLGGGCPFFRQQA